MIHNFKTMDFESKEILWKANALRYSLYSLEENIIWANP